MPARLHLAGKQFGRLTVENEVADRPLGSVLWKCICTCGNHKTVSSYHLSRGKVRSCGCLVTDLVTARNRAGALQITPQTTKFCTQCELTKPIADFYLYKDANRLSIRYRSKCRPCQSVLSKPRQRLHYLQNTEVYKERGRKSRLTERYGLTEKEVFCLLETQNKCCALCNKAFINRFEIEHSHSCETNHASNRIGCKKCIRGLVCTRCNHAIGAFENHPDLLLATEKLKTYLASRPFLKRESLCAANGTNG